MGNTSLLTVSGPLWCTLRSCSGYFFGCGHRLERRSDRHDTPNSIAGMRMNSVHVEILLGASEELSIRLVHQLQRRKSPPVRSVTPIAPGSRVRIPSTLTSWKLPSLMYREVGIDPRNRGVQLHRGLGAAEGHSREHSAAQVDRFGFQRVRGCRPGPTPPARRRRACVRGRSAPGRNPLDAPVAAVV